MQQLECKICKTKRELTEEEIREAVELIDKRNLKPDSMFKIWNIFDGDVCPEGGTHEYRWNNEFFEKMMDDAEKVRDSELQITKNTNENIDLTNKIEQLKAETENKIKEMTERIEKNKESNIQTSQSTQEIKDNTLKVSGREWKKWLG